MNEVTLFAFGMQAGLQLATLVATMLLVVMGSGGGNGGVRGRKPPLPLQHFKRWVMPDPRHFKGWRFPRYDE